MTIQCGIVGKIPFDVSPEDKFQVSFDIANWLDEDTIASVAYSAVDKDGETATSSVLDSDKHENTTTVIKPYVMGGGTDEKRYTVKMLATMASGQIKAFYIKFRVNAAGGA